jgi:hypothetical protein
VLPRAHFDIQQFQPLNEASRGCGFSHEPMLLKQTKAFTREKRLKSMRSLQLANTFKMITKQYLALNVLVCIG